MKHCITILILLFYSVNNFAQTGIGTTTPNASAKLDVYSTNKGFLPPRVTLTSATDATTIANPAEGLLVYNVGSAGLQAGYYYWNNANWATIATATSAGNGVTASDLVKIYDGVGNAATINSTGATFSVTTSGRYLFDFSTSATCGGCTLILNFRVRDGANNNAVIGSDMQTSYNNNVHAEYNGKVEVNLIAGRSYNVTVTASSGGIYDNDYTRVYMKQVAGNLPVTGQTVEYGIARYTGADVASLSTGSIVGFDAAASGNLSWSGNKFTLKANKTYIVESSLAIFGGSGGSAGRFQIYDYTNSTSLANGLFMSHGGTGTNFPNANTPMKCVVTPTSDIQVGIKLEGNYGTAPGIIGSTSTVSTYGSSNASYFIVQQIGSSAIVNPWTLSGTNSYNTTGNVGIGTNNPTEKLEVTGNVKADNFLGIASSSKTYLLEAYANATYSLPGSYTVDPCRYNVVSNTVNVPSSWFNTSTYTFTPQKAGYWEIRASYDVYRSGEAALVISKNGSDVGVIGAISAVILIVNKVIYLNGSTDYIKINNTGYNSNSRSQGASASWFQARWVGE